MLNTINKMDKKAKTFLFFFLHTIFFSAAAILVYGIYTSASASALDTLMLGYSGRITTEYLLISLCECIGGALFLDYTFRKSGAFT